MNAWLESAAQVGASLVVALILLGLSGLIVALACWTVRASRWLLRRVFG